MIATPDTLLPNPTAAAPAPPRAQQDPLTTLLSSSLPIADLAASLSLALPDFLTLSQSPDFQSQLAAIDDLTQTRVRIQSAQARLTAIQALESLTRTAQDPVERRRAAASLMRATCHRSPLGDVDVPATHGADNASRTERPRPRHLPSRRLRVDQVATLIARALADNGAPTPDSGLATLHAFLSPDTRAASPQLPDFINAAHDQADDDQGATTRRALAARGAESPCAHLREPVSDLPLPDLPALTDLLDSAEPATCSAPTQHGRTATIDLHRPASSTNAQYPVPRASPIRFHLTRPDTGPLRMCWLIDRITHTLTPTTATGPPNINEP